MNTKIMNGILIRALFFDSDFTSYESKRARSWKKKPAKNKK